MVPRDRVFKELRHEALFAVFLALFSAGSSIEAKIAMIAITTRSSISVNGTILFFIFSPFCFWD
jgi:hypothetical protein